jgi:hypothetical protein
MSRGVNRSAQKDVKNEGRRNVYENKGPRDNLPDTKDDICAGLHVVLRKNARILWELTTLLQLFEPWITNRLLQKVETREASRKVGPMLSR